MTDEEKAKAGFVGVRGDRPYPVGPSEAPDFVKDEIKAAKTRQSRRPAQPGVKLYATDSGWTMDSPHSDLAGWEAQIADAFGTRSHGAMWTFLAQLKRLVGKRYTPEGGGDDRYKPDELELNFALSFIHSTRPRNELEACLAAQMVAVHFLSMRASETALSRMSCGLDERAAAQVSRLARTFTMQVDAMRRLKGRGSTKQRITVRYERHDHQHQHVHMHDGGPDEIGEQPHRSKRVVRGAARNLRPDPPKVVEHVSGPALLGQEPQGNVVPIARDQEGPLSPSRRRGWFGRSEG